MLRCRAIKLLTLASLGLSQHKYNHKYNHKRNITHEKITVSRFVFG
ncbi:hypothetical protein CRENPOLYSF1_250004 [Crenothrix polyspora]|uniref:Uncharacterized protein n=1 Tax=Crenothrix polyspora TaxID=360316 RepID=A0A1R4H7J9_9GAMM|nr:hypothetical protein CRENPOLYSF1_250004 [Crenothrix polyspora]